MDEKITIKKERGQCDICSRFTWVRVQYLGDIQVAKQCKTCEEDI